LNKSPESQRPRAHGRHDEHAACDGEILFKMQQFILIGEVRMEQHCRREAKEAEQSGSDPWQHPQGDRQSRAQLKRYHRHDQGGAYPGRGHCLDGIVEMGCERNPLMQENEG
jgi:hypothetical protein